MFLSNIQNGAASTWTKLASPTGTEGHPFNIKVLNDGNARLHLFGKEKFVGDFHAQSGVFVSTNFGTTWTNRSDPGMLYWTKDLVVDPNDATEKTWYVGVFSGWGGPPNGLGGLYRTTDRGVSWSRINNLDRSDHLRIQSAESERGLSDHRRQTGLWNSTNITSATPSFTQGRGLSVFASRSGYFSNPYQPSEIWVTSFGHGMMTASTVSQSARCPEHSNWTRPRWGRTALWPLTLQQATPGASYAIQVSTYLSNWVSLTTNVAGTNGVLQFNAHERGWLYARFYRALGQ